MIPQQRPWCMDNVAHSMPPMVTTAAARSHSHAKVVCSCPPPMTTSRCTRGGGSLPHAPHPHPAHHAVDHAVLDRARRPWVWHCWLHGCRCCLMSHPHPLLQAVVHVRTPASCQYSGQSCAHARTRAARMATYTSTQRQYPSVCQYPALAVTMKPRGPPMAECNCAGAPSLLAAAGPRASGPRVRPRPRRDPSDVAACEDTSVLVAPPGMLVAASLRRPPCTRLEWRSKFRIAATLVLSWDPVAASVLAVQTCAFVR